MLTRTRVVAVVAGTVSAALFSGGVAWAGIGGSLPVPGHHRSAADVTTTTVGDTTTTVADTSTTVADDTTTTVEDTTTTTTASATTTTTPADEPTEPKAPKTSTGCKPGWGYGDKNHCHSGPPGLSADHLAKHPKHHTP